MKAANLHKKLTLAPIDECLPGPFRFPIVHWRATSRLLYFAHILSAGDHVGAGSDASHGGRISDALWCWPRWYVRGTQGMGGSLLQLDHQTGMKYFCNLSSSWQPPETFYLIHKRCQKYQTQSLMRVGKKVSWFNCYPKLIPHCVRLFLWKLADYDLWELDEDWDQNWRILCELESKNICVEREHLFPFSSFSKV